MNAGPAPVSAEPAERADAPAAIDVGLMRLCGRHLSIPAAAVREVVPLPPTLHPDFSGTGACAGSILVRGRTIPVLDIAPRLGLPTRDPATGVVVILRHESRLIGLIMDAVSGLARIARDRIQPIVVPADSPSPLVGSSFPHGVAVIGLIEPAAVFALPGVPHAQETGAGSEQCAAGVRTPLVLVRVADVNMALRADRVVATVPCVRLEPSVAPGSDWVGTVHYLGLEIPVVDNLALFGLAGRAAPGGGAITLLRYDETRILGLKIDGVRRIVSPSERSIQPLPPALRAQLPLFEGAVVDHEGLQNLLLGRDALDQGEEPRLIARLCRQSGPTAAQPLQSGSAARGTGEPSAFIVFDTGRSRRAAALGSIKQVIPFPDTFTPVSRPGSALQGIASYRGAPLPLLDLAGARPRPSDDHRDKVVLVVEKEGAFNGLVVDRLETITRAVAQRSPGPLEDRRFIQARVNEQTSTVTLCDLAQEAEALTGQSALG